LKKRSYLLIAALLFSATPLSAGLRYEFTKSVRTEETSTTTNLVARAVVEGEMSRLDVLAGNRYEPGSYIITHGDRRIYVVDPAKKSYVEYTSNQNNPINPERVKIIDPKVTFTEIDEATPTLVAGYPTRHFRLKLQYDITVLVGTITIRQNVETVIDKWMTTAFDSVISDYRDNLEDFKTGSPAVDTLLEAEATRFKGLALRERVEIVTRIEKKSRNVNNNLPSTRKHTSEMVVTKIEQVQVSPNYFVIPVEYTKGSADKAPSTTTQYLTMQPDRQ
jgi:hypothetical protein